jgi:pre-60S factor REI1
MALTRKDKRINSLMNQLANLSVNDRASLDHLSEPEQLAVLATQRKQLEKARRAEQRYRRHLEIKGNRTLMGTFQMDVPGRTNG